MLNAFHISASSMQAHQIHVDVIANNLANANTSGFKKSKVEFSDLMYSELASVINHLNNPDLYNPMGMGTAATTIQKVFSQGDIKSTDRDLDLAIQGKGFFELLLPAGEYAYTRTGHFQVNGEGMLVNADGHLLSPSIQVPPDTKSVLVTNQGAVMVNVSEQGDPVEVGRIELAGFINPGGLVPLGNNLYRPSQESGSAYFGEPGERDFGGLAQGFLEGSNVNLIEELTNMMLARRGYEMNAKMIQAADDMLGIVNNLRR